MTVSAIIASLNLPSQIRGKKRNLYPHPLRTEAAIRLWNRLDVEVCSLQELATMSRTQIRARRRWGLVTTTNDVFPFRRIGNGVAWRKDRWRLVARDAIYVETPTHPKRGIRFPVARLRCIDEPTVELIVIAVHIPTAVAMGEALRRGKDSPEVIARRNKINGQVLNEAERYATAGLPVVIAGDFNDGDVRNVYQSWTVGAQHRVDQVLGKGLKFTSKNAADVGRISDHPAMPYVTANLTIPRI